MHVSSELERVLNMKTQDDASDRIDVMCQYRAVFHPQENRSWMCTTLWCLPRPLPSPTTLPESLKPPERCAELCRTHSLPGPYWPLNSPDLHGGHATPWAFAIDKSTNKALVIEVLLHRLWLSTLLNRVTCHESRVSRNRAENERTERLKPNFSSVVPRTGGCCKGPRGQVQAPAGWSAFCRVSLHFMLSSSPLCL